MFEKIKKNVCLLINEKRKNELNFIKKAVEFQKPEYRTDFTKAFLFNNNRDYEVINATLTPKQSKKTLEEKKEILSKKINDYYDKKINDYMNYYEEIEKSAIPKTLNIEALFTKNRTWGVTCKAILKTEKNIYYSGVASGWGYDKESTASADVLNQCKGLLKLIYLNIEKMKIKDIKTLLVNNDIRNVFGYGLNAFYKIYFAGGVGFSSHRNILNNLGYELRNDFYNNMSNIYYFSLDNNIIKKYNL